MPDPAQAFINKDDGPEFPGGPPEQYWFEEDARHFMRKNEEGAWITLTESQLVRNLKKQFGLRDKPLPGKITSQAHDVLHEVENNRRVAYAGILAGYKSGLHRIAGRRVLITEDPVFIEPQAGTWPILAQILERLLCGEEPGVDGGQPIKIDQRPWFFGWLQHALQCYYEGNPAPGLALCLAGDPNCGKSFLALILRWLFGGRVAKPYRFMMGLDNFNRDLVESVLQLIDDESQAETSYLARQKFASEIKQLVANNEFRVRAMHSNPFAVPLLRRLVVLCNLQGTRLLVLPPLDGDVDDKLILLKGYCRPAPAAPITSATPYEDACWPMPKPTRNEAEKEVLRETVKAELPAFLHWLLVEYKMPPEVSGGRFVVRHYHHPVLVAALHEHSPHTRLWELILRARVVFSEYRCDGADQPAEWVPRAEWRGSAGDLEQLLRKNDVCQLSKEERSEIKAANWLGRTLDLCRQHFGKEVCDQVIEKKARVWVLRPRKEDVIS